MLPAVMLNNPPPGKSPLWQCVSCHKIAGDAGGHTEGGEVGLYTPSTAGVKLESLYYLRLGQ